MSNIHYYYYYYYYYHLPNSNISREHINEKKIKFKFTIKITSITDFYYYVRACIYERVRSCVCVCCFAVSIFLHVCDSKPVKRGNFFLKAAVFLEAEITRRHIAKCP